MNLRKIKIAVVCILIIITILSAWSYFSGEVSSWQIFLGIMGKKFAMAVSAAAVTWIFYEFFKVFFAKHPKKKLICGSLAALAVALCIMWYVLDHRPKVVHMQEDVLYIMPKSDVQAP